MHTWAGLAAERAAHTWGIELGAFPARWWDSLGGVAVDVLVAGVGFASMSARRAANWPLPPIGIDIAPARPRRPAGGRLIRFRRRVDGLLTGMLSDDVDEISPVPAARRGTVRPDEIAERRGPAVSAWSGDYVDALTPARSRIGSWDSMRDLAAGDARSAWLLSPTITEDPLPPTRAGTQDRDENADGEFGAAQATGQADAPDAGPMGPDDRTERGPVHAAEVAGSASGAPDRSEGVSGQSAGSGACDAGPDEHHRARYGVHGVGEPAAMDSTAAGPGGDESGTELSQPDPGEPETDDRSAAVARAADPDPGEPRTGDPYAGEPRAGEPHADEPTVAEPRANEGAAERGAEPRAAEPRAAEPRAAEPRAAGPGSAEPGSGEPGSADSGNAVPWAGGPTADESFWGPGGAADSPAGGGYRSKHRSDGPAKDARPADGRRAKPRHAAPPASLGATITRGLSNPRLTSRSAAHAAS